MQPSGFALGAADLELGRTYTPEELAGLFGFKPYYLRTTGGMVSVPAKGVLLLVTHAGSDASFEYEDYWEGDDLVYTGRGQDGDQKLAGSNRDVAENRRALCVFEHAGKYQRRFVGTANCTRYWWALAPDLSGTDRRVLRFYLRFNESGRAIEPEPSPTKSSPRSAVTLPPHRRPRAFDERATRAPSIPARPSRLTPAECAQLAEKLNAMHHGLLVALKRRLESDGWSEIEEIPAAVDLWARRSDVRVIFEAKTIGPGNELDQTRSALSQLLEYRFFYGAPGDTLCLVTSALISDRRLRFLDAMNVRVLWFDGRAFLPCGRQSHLMLNG